MPLNLSVKNAPDEIVKRLKERAARHHRSLQGELMAILEAAAYEEPRPLTPQEVLALVRAAGTSTPSPPPPNRNPSPGSPRASLQRSADHL